MFNQVSDCVSFTHSVSWNLSAGRPASGGQVPPKTFNKTTLRCRVAHVFHRICNKTHGTLSFFRWRTNVFLEKTNVFSRITNVFRLGLNRNRLLTSVSRFPQHFGRWPRVIGQHPSIVRHRPAFVHHYLTDVCHQLTVVQCLLTIELRQPMTVSPILTTVGSPQKDVLGSFMAHLPL